MTYSEDLRERVVGFVRAGGGKSAAARRYNVSRGTVYGWLSLETLEPKKQGCPGPWKLDPEKLKAHVEAYPDAYQHERGAALGVSRHVVLYGLKRLGIRRKKNAIVPREKRRVSQEVSRDTGDDS